MSIWAAGQWLQDLPFIESLRVSLWGYPLVSAMHIAAFALLFGAIAVVDLRLLRTGRMDPETHQGAIRIALTGCAMAILTGMVLLTVKAVEYLGSAVLWWKFAAILAGGCNALLLHGLFWCGLALPLSYVRLAAGISLAAWSTVILSGRLLGFL